MLCKKKQEFTAGGLIEQSVYEARSTTSIISRFISSSLRRDNLGQGMTPYGLLTVTSE
jgi:hypothetical protein